MGGAIMPTPFKILAYLQTFQANLPLNIREMQLTLTWEDTIKQQHKKASWQPD